MFLSTVLSYFWYVAGKSGIIKSTIIKSML